MLQLEMPHVNVLSKIDLLRQEDLALGLDYYTEVMDLRFLRRHLDKELPKSFKKLNKAMCGLVEDFSLVSFCTLEIQNKESVADLLKVIDKSNGYVFGGLTAGNESIMAVAAQEYAQCKSSNCNNQSDHLYRWWSLVISIMIYASICCRINNIFFCILLSSSMGRSR
jgi:hypothetical protein